MRYSTFAASLLLSTAAAWRFPDYNWGNPGWGSATTSAPAIVAPSATQTSAVQVPATSAAAAPSSTATPSTPSGSSDSGSLTSDEQNALDAHNNARADVGTKDLTWDTSLAADALAYAKTLAASGSFQHSGVSDQGENLYMQSGSNAPLLAAVNAFLEEKKLYNGEAITSSNYMNFGHYTQVVWKDTTKVGMGAAKGSDGNTYVVARYKVPGNFIGEKAY